MKFIESVFNLDFARKSDIENNLKESGIYMYGVGFDDTASFRKGAAFAPDEIRKVSHQIEYYSPYLDSAVVEDKFFDLGNLIIDQKFSKEEKWLHLTKVSQQIVKSCLTSNSAPILIGGDHSVPFGQIETFLKAYPDLMVIHLDAHADLRDGYLGEYFSHASIIRMIKKEFSAQNKLMQFGIRSGTQEEFLMMKKDKTLYDDINVFLSDLDKYASNNRPIYLTLDVDFFDPAFMPGTGTPEAGGEDFKTFNKIIKSLAMKNFVGADIVELAPHLDATNNSSVFTALILREMVIALQNAKKL